MSRSVFYSKLVRRWPENPFFNSWWKFIDGVNRWMQGSGFNLTFQKWFVSLPNEINSKTDLEYHSPWFRDKKYLHSRLPKLVLNSIFTFFISQKKNIRLASCTRSFKQTVSKNCVKNHLKIFVIRSWGILHKHRKIYTCFYKNPTIQTKFLPESAAK